MSNQLFCPPSCSVRRAGDFPRFALVPKRLKHDNLVIRPLRANPSRPSKMIYCFKGCEAARP